MLQLNLVTKGKLLTTLIYIRMYNIKPKIFKQKNYKLRLKYFKSNF